MDFMKYIMFNDHVAVIFDPQLSHKDVARGLQTASFKPTSAGFFSVTPDFPSKGGDYQIRVSCFGESTTLNMKANPKDEYWIAKRLDPYRE